MSLTLKHGQKVIEADGSTFVSGICEVLKEPYTTGPIPRKGLIEWMMGSHIQTALPHISLGDREFLKSGMSPDGWESVFTITEENKDI